MHVLPFFALYLLLVPLRADAYLDPGSGSLVFQVLIAFFVGIGFAVKTNWLRVKAMFGRKHEPRVKHGKTDEEERPKTDA